MFCSPAFLDYFDIFRFPLTLSLNNKNKTSTLTGKLISVGIMVFLLYSFNQSDVLNKKNPLILSQDLLQTVRPPLWFSKQNFTLIVGVADGNNNFLIDETIFSLYFSTVSLNNTDHTYNQTRNLLLPCLQEDLIENPAEFVKLGLEGAFCLPNEPLNLSGYYDEPLINYLYFEVRTCENSSDSDLICQQPEVISNVLSNYYIDIYLTDNNIDASNYLTPLSRNLKIYYEQLDVMLMKSMQIFMQTSVIDTDDGFFFQSQKLIKSFLIGEIDYDVASNANMGNLVFEICIYASDVQTQISRNYQKIQTLLAQMGGICNFLFILGFCISKIENSYQLISYLSNELFIFPKIDNNPSLLSTKSTNRETVDTLISSREGKKPQKISKILNLKKIHQNKDKITQKILISQPALKKSLTFNGENLKTERHFRKMKSAPPTILIENKQDLSLSDKGENPKKEISFKNFNSGPPKILIENEPHLSFRESGNFVKKVDNSNLKGLFEKDMKIRANWYSSPKEKIKAAFKFGKLSLKMKKAESMKIEKIAENLEYYQKMKNKENFFSLGLWGFIKLLLKKRRFFLTIKEKLFMRSESQIAEQMDILKILQKLQDIEKLKRILLNDEQLNLINLVSKPIIKLDNKQKIYLKKGLSKDKRFRFSLSERPNLEKDKLRKNYEQVNRKAEGSEIDQRILKLLDEDVMRFLKNEIWSDE